MSFEWQDRDAAAGTLGVDSKTLQAWIDDGRAPSRTYQGRLQVLIEHIEESEAEASAQQADEKKTSEKHGEKQHAEPKATGQSKTEAGARGRASEDEDASAEQGQRAERVHAQATTTDLELVSKRELQLAGGMVAAWQRLAETSNQDLARARKVGTLSWSLVAVLVLVSGIGLWFSTRSVTDAQGKLDATREKLADTERTATETASRARALQLEVTQRTQDLSEANSKLAATVERANLTKSQADAFAAQHLLTKQLADQQIETAKALATALQSTIDQQKLRQAELEKELAVVNTKLAAAEKQNTKDHEALAEATRQRDALQKQVEQITADHGKATLQIDDLKKQMATMKTELDKLKKEPTTTAEKTGN